MSPLLANIFLLYIQIISTFFLLSFLFSLMVFLSLRNNIGGVKISLRALIIISQWKHQSQNSVMGNLLPSNIKANWRIHWHSLNEKLDQIREVWEIFLKSCIKGMHWIHWQLPLQPLWMNSEQQEVQSFHPNNICSKVEIEKKNDQILSSFLLL